MIDENKAKRYCRDDITKIENYEQAKNDKEHKWVCHHRLEFTLEGEFAHSKQDLIRLEMYYHRPYFELIFMKRDEHLSLHHTGKFVTNETKRKLSEVQKGRKLSKEHKRNVSEALKGRKHSEEHNRKVSEAKLTEFGIKFKEHYGLTCRDNFKLYKSEHAWYKRHNDTCRWEKENE